MKLIPETSQLREALIRKLRTGKGGWDAEALNLIGVSWPPYSGWKKNFIKEGNKNVAATVNNLITEIREATGTTRWLNGDCYKLFKILKTVFPNAEPWYDRIQCHIYTKIDGKFYDIKGESQPDVIPLSECEPWVIEGALTWEYMYN